MNLPPFSKDKDKEEALYTRIKRSISTLKLKKTDSTVAMLSPRHSLKVRKGKEKELESESSFQHSQEEKISLDALALSPRPILQKQESKRFSYFIPQLTSRHLKDLQQITELELFTDKKGEKKEKSIVIGYCKIEAFNKKPSVLPLKVVKHEIFDEDYHRLGVFNKVFTEKNECLYEIHEIEDTWEYRNLFFYLIRHLVNLEEKDHLEEFIEQVILGLRLPELKEEEKLKNAPFPRHNSFESFFTKKSKKKK